MVSDIICITFCLGSKTFPNFCILGHPNSLLIRLIYCFYVLYVPIVCASAPSSLRINACGSENVVVESFLDREGKAVSTKKCSKWFVEPLLVLLTGMEPMSRISAMMFSATTFATLLISFLKSFQLKDNDFLSPVIGHSHLLCSFLSIQDNKMLLPKKSLPINVSGV